MKRALIFLVSSAAVSVVAVSPGVGVELSASGRDFGQHVSECAQTMGFDAAHNPGMHEGRSGWDGLPC
jgi:hypothetical protein